MAADSPPTASRSSSDENVPFLSQDTSPEEDSPQIDHGQQASNNQAADFKQISLIKRQLFTSHLLSTWNSRVFEFGAVLFLARIFPGTLLPSSVYALVRAAAAICFSPAIGNYIDQGERLRVVKTSIVGQRVAVVTSCLSFLVLTIADFEARAILLAILCLLATVEKLCSVMNLIAIERDWVVVIAQSTQSDLEALNSQIRRIDLGSKLFGPLFIALIDGISTTVAISVVLGMGLVSVFVEYYAIARVYHSVTGLRSPGNDSRTHDEDNAERQPTTSQALSKLQQCCRSLSYYLHHKVFLPSIALSVLYFTVLSFSGQMVTYLVSLNFTSMQIGFMRTASVALEMSATWLAPTVIHRIGPVRTGLWSINWQLLCLVPTVSLFAIIQTPYTAALVMVAGVVLSRIGLWGFDLSVQLLVQEVRWPTIVT